MTRFLLSWFVVLVIVAVVAAAGGWLGFRSGVNEFHRRSGEKPGGIEQSCPDSSVRGDSPSASDDDVSHEPAAVAAAREAMRGIRHDPELLVLLGFGCLVLFKIVAKKETPVDLMRCALTVIARLLHDVVQFLTWVRYEILRDLGVDERWLRRGVDDAADSPGSEGHRVRRRA